MASARRKMPKNWSKAAKDSARLPAMSPRRSTWYGARSERASAASDASGALQMFVDVQGFTFQVLSDPKLFQDGPRRTRLSTMSPRRSTRHGARSERASATSDGSGALQMFVDVQAYFRFSKVYRTYMGTHGVFVLLLACIHLRDAPQLLSLIHI